MSLLSPRTKALLAELGSPERGEHAYEITQEDEAALAGCEIKEQADLIIELEKLSVPALKALEEKIRERRKKLEELAEFTRPMLARKMEAAGAEDSGAHDPDDNWKASYVQAGKGRVEVVGKAEDLPAIYQRREILVKADTEAIRQALEAGVEIACRNTTYVRLVREPHVRILLTERGKDRLLEIQGKKLLEVVP